MNDKGFKALTRICLNNWHYISHKVLSLNSGINFFTGHWGAESPRSLTPCRSFSMQTQTAAGFSIRRLPMIQTEA